MAEPILSLRDIHKSFGALEVLKGVDLDVEKGEVVCILGPSGSGKSTLLRCVNLLEPPEDGDIYLEGKAICRGPGSGEGEAGWNLDFVRQRVGMVFQQFNLFPHKTALENVTMAPEKVLGKSRAEAREKATALLERVGKPTSLIRFVEDRPGHDRRYAIDTSRIRRELGWRPARDWRHTLNDTIDWYLDNPAWWQAIRDEDERFRAFYDRQYAERLREDAAHV